MAQLCASARFFSSIRVHCRSRPPHSRAATTTVTTTGAGGAGATGRATGGIGDGLKEELPLHKERRRGAHNGGTRIHQLLRSRNVDKCCGLSADFLWTSAASTHCKRNAHNVRVASHRSAASHTVPERSAREVSLRSVLPPPYLPGHAATTPEKTYLEEVTFSESGGAPFDSRESC